MITAAAVVGLTSNLQAGALFPVVASYHHVCAVKEYDSFVDSRGLSIPDPVVTLVDVSVSGSAFLGNLFMGNDEQTHSVAEVLTQIDSIVSDEDQYEPDESKPASETVEAIKRLVQEVASSGLDRFPRTYVSVYYGEIDLTWKTTRNLVRLIVHPIRGMELYEQSDYRESPRGNSRSITSADGLAIANSIRSLTGKLACTA